MNDAPATMTLPHQTAWLYRGFRKYCVRSARKHFHAVRLSQSGSPLPCDGSPILIAMNHPGWWDPIVGCVLSLEFKGYSHFAAIDAVAVQKYAVMKRLGFVPVDRTSLRGAAEFLKTGEVILSQPRTAFWLTAQGEFADVRQRPLALQSGVGHLAARMTSGCVLPVALEYCFWNESKPEALIRVGEMMRIESGRNAKVWTARIEDALTNTLERLNAEAMSRDAAKFASLVAGRAGMGGIYDFARRVKAMLTGKKFDASHGGESA
ncbi:lysophospholipid acyltransferase family protein [soil metagenome]